MDRFYIRKSPFGRGGLVRFAPAGRIWESAPTLRRDESRLYELNQYPSERMAFRPQIPRG